MYRIMETGSGKWIFAKLSHTGDETIGFTSNKDEADFWLCDEITGISELADTYPYLRRYYNKGTLIYTDENGKEI